MMGAGWKRKMRRLERVARGVGFGWRQEEVVAVEEEVAVELLVLRDHVSYRQLLLGHRPAKVFRGRACGGIRGREGEGTVVLFRLECTGPRYRAAVPVIGAHGRTSKEDRVRRHSGGSRSWAGDGRDVSRLRDPIPAAVLFVDDGVGARAGVERERR